MQKNILLKNYSSYKIGGPASFFLKISNTSDLEGLNPVQGLTPKVFVLGGGTNLLISDAGFDGLVIYNKILGTELKNGELHLGAGELISDILSFCIQHGLSGLEWAGGLPGTIGGAVRGNAGAFKGEIKDNVFEVESYNIRTKKFTRKKNENCEFGYRMSFFKKNPDEIITSVILELVKRDREEIKRQTQEKIDYRILKHPMEYPNIGSTFKNIPVNKVTDEQKIEFADFTKDDPFPVVLTTKLLALANLKGKREGDAQISEKHPNFIVNLGNAKSSDVLTLVEIARSAVKRKFGIELEEEIQYLQS